MFIYDGYNQKKGKKIIQIIKNNINKMKKIITYFKTM